MFLLGNNFIQQHAVFHLNEYLELIFRRILTGCCYWPSARSFIGVLVLLIIKLPKVDFCLNHNLSELGKWELQFCIFFSSERTCYPERQFNKSFFFPQNLNVSIFKGQRQNFFFFPANLQPWFWKGWRKESNIQITSIQL